MKMYVTAATVKLTTEEQIELAHDTENPRILTRLALEHDVQVLNNVLDNEHTPAYALAHIVNLHSSYPSYLGHAIVNPNCTEDLKHRIMDMLPSMNPRVAGYIAAHTDDPEIIDWLCSSESGRVGVAGHYPHIDEDLALEFATDGHDNVRQELARNKYATADALGILVYDPSYFVRRAAISNPNLKQEDRINALGDCPIQDIVNYTSDTLKGWSAGAVHCLVDRLLSTTEVALAEVAQAFRGLVKSSILSEQDVERIASMDFDDQDYCRLWGFWVPPKYADIFARQYVAHGFAFDDADLMRIGCLEDLAHKCSSLEFLTECSRSPIYRLREAAAGNSHTPEEILQKLAKDKSKRVRTAAEVTLNRLGANAVQTPDAPAPERNSVNQYWSAPAYRLESYGSISDELDGVIAKVMAKLSEQVGQLTYQFDTDDYDTMDKLTITKADGTTITCDAQILLATLTSSDHKPTAIKKGVEYLMSKGSAIVAQ